MRIRDEYLHGSDLTGVVKKIEVTTGTGNNANKSVIKYTKADSTGGIVEVPIGDITGKAATASKLDNTSAIGSKTNPVYFTEKGVPSACTYSLNATVPAGAANQVLYYSASNTLDTQSYTTLTSNLDVFTVATASAAGKKGLVPAPSANQLGAGNFFLRADGVWTVIENKTAVLNGTATSLVTTGEKYNWNSAYNWYNTMTSGDTDGTINKWKEVEAFLANYGDSSTLAAELAKLVTLSTDQTITGVKTFSQVINGSITGNADTVDGYHASAFATAEHTHSYLPLSGGIMTGSISFPTDSHGIYFLSGCGIEKWEGYGPMLVAEGNNTDFWIRNGKNRDINYLILHAGNYNSYAPKLDGTGASGTWGINISGNAATATMSTKLSCQFFDTASQITHDYTLWINSAGCSDIPSMSFASILYVGYGTNRRWQIWNSRYDHTLYWRPEKADSSDFADVHALIDDKNISSYLPTVTDYYWANIKISNTANSDTSPTFDSPTIKTKLSIASSSLTKNYPTDLQLVINGPDIASGITPELKDWPGIGFHMPNKNWGSLIYNGNITALNGNYDGYINYYGAGFLKDGSSDSYVLLGGGGHKALTDFSMSHSHPYLPLSGGTVTGTLGKDNNYIFKPNGGDFRTIGGTYTGAICISLPDNIDNTTLSMWIDVYNYLTNTSFSVHVGGYTFSNSTFDYNPFAMVYGASHKVRLTYNNGFKIYIGETNLTWSSPLISIRDVVLGTRPNYSNWCNDWNISFVTSFPAIDIEITRYAITTDNIGLQSVNYATSAGSAATASSVDWSGVTNRPTNVSEFTNDAGYLTSTSLNNYVTLNTAQTITEVKTFASSKFILAGIEYSDIKHAAQKTYNWGGYGGKNTIPNYTGMYNSLDFHWYDDIWSIGNLRSAGFNTNGFGIGLKKKDNNDNLYFAPALRITETESYINNNKIWHAGNLTKVSQLTNDKGYLTSHAYSYGSIDIYDVNGAKKTSNNTVSASVNTETLRLQEGANIAITATNSGTSGSDNIKIDVTGITSNIDRPGYGQLLLWYNGASNASAILQSVTYNEILIVKAGSGIDFNGHNDGIANNDVWTISAIPYNCAITLNNNSAKSLIKDSWSTDALSIYLTSNGTSSGTSLAAGTYALWIEDRSSLSGTPNYYSGTFTCAGSAAAGRLDEIALHSSMATSADTNAPTRIFVATLISNTSGKHVLRFCSLDSSATSHYLTVKVNRII